MIFGNFGFQGGGQTTIGGLTYLGTWDALTNNPTLTSGVGLCGGYYIVSVAGTTNLDGVTDWQIGDWAIFECNSNQWQKIDNHDIVSYNTIQEEGVSLPPQTTIDFQGAGVTATNGVGKTIVTINGNIPTTNYGLYAQTENSTPITATTIESSLIGTGLGTLSVPPNTFQVGDSFVAKLYGHITCIGTATIEIRVKSGSIILADTGIVALNASTAKHWCIEINFTIREIGGVGIASIVSGGLFSYVKNAGTNFEGTNFSIINNSTFDTTILNTLDVTAQWNTTNVGNTMFSESFVLNKIY